MLEPFLIDTTQEDIEYDIEILQEKAQKYQCSVEFMRILLEDAEEGDQIIQDINIMIDKYNIKIDQINNKIDNLTNKLLEDNLEEFEEENKDIEKEAVDKNHKTVIIKITM